MEPRGCNRRQSTATRPARETAKTSGIPLPPAATGCLRRSMVRRGSTVRVRQRASMKCLQIGTLLLSAHQTRGHETDTSTVRATHRDVARPLPTQLSGRDTNASINEIPAEKARSLSGLARGRPPLYREGVIGIKLDDFHGRRRVGGGRGLESPLHGVANILEISRELLEHESYECGVKKPEKTL